MVVLDTTISNVATPTIAGYLGVSTTEGTWIITAYAVAEAITVPLTGWLARQFGQVRLFVFSVIAFVIFSVLCGLSGSLGMLIVFRILQGFAGGPLIPLSSTLMMSIFPERRSSVAISIWGMTTVVAPIFGLILGGYISDNFYWGWIFYINILFGGLVGAVSWMLMRDRETPIQRSKIDYVGLLLLVAFVTTFQVMLDQGRELDWFSSPLIVVMAVIAFVAVVLLIIWELTDDEPVLDLSVFASRNWLISTLTLSLMFGLFFGNIVLTPLWLQQSVGYTATWAGYAMAPMGVLAVVTSPIVGRLLPRIDPRLIVTFGMGVLAVSFFMRMQLTTDAGFVSVAWAMFVLSNDSRLDQRLSRWAVVYGGYGLMDGAFQVICVGEGLVSQLALFHLTPDNLDVVQFGSVLGQPLGREPMVASFERRRGGLAPMDRTVVEYDHDGFCGQGARLWTVELVQLLKMSNEVSAALGAARMDNQRPPLPVPAAHHGDFGCLTGCRNAQVRALLGPSSGEVGVGQSLALVGEQQDDVAGLSLSFQKFDPKAAAINRISVLASLQSVPRATESKTPFFAAPPTAARGRSERLLVVRSHRPTAAKSNWFGPLPAQSTAPPPPATPPPPSPARAQRRRASLAKRSQTGRSRSARAEPYPLGPRRPAQSGHWSSLPASTV